jgi:hypothetical protein
MGLIGSAISAAGNIFGGIKASKAMKKAKRNVEAQRQKNQDWYDRRYNEDATQRADAQRILTQTEESIKQRNKAAAGSAAVMGGTDESVAAAKEANNKALADATSQIAADAEARKDNIEATYMQNDNAFVEQLNAIEQGKANAISGAVQGVTNAVSQMPF